jgi:hypothetical protein
MNSARDGKCENWRDLTPENVLGKPEKRSIPVDISTRYLNQDTAELTCFVETALKAESRLSMLIVSYLALQCQQSVYAVPQQPVSWLPSCPVIKKKTIISADYVRFYPLTWLWKGHFA